MRKGIILLMICAIATIVAFQAYWLRQNYKEEQHLFAARTNLLFRETLFRLQASKLHLDSNNNVHVQDRFGMVSIANVLKERYYEGDSAGARDSFPITAGNNQSIDRFHRVRIVRDRLSDFSELADSIRPAKNIKDKVIFISVDRKPGDQANHADSADHIYYRSRTTPGVIRLLTGIDSLQDPITIGEASGLYAKALAKEGINVSFSISMSPLPRSFSADFEPPDFDDNSAVLGFSKPIRYQVQFGSIFWYMAGRIGSRLAVSFLLVGVTLLSFLLLYRNWQRQRRLAEMKNDLISNITHELKTPIATVSVAVEALKNFNALEDPQKTKEYLNISGNELQRLSLLVDKVLKMSMFEKRQIELRKEPFDFASLIQEVIRSMQPLFEKKGAVIDCFIETRQTLLVADKLHIAGSLYNLLDNALKYTSGIPVIEVRLTSPRENIFQLRVKDNGIGIPREYRRRIFDKFFRIPAGDRHDIKGYGLGLSYAAEIMKHHMGFIVVESEVGKGSTFIVSLPMQEAPLIIFDDHRRIVKKKLAFPK